MEELFKHLDTLHLNKNEYTITGSGPLYAHGLISSIDNDLDIIVQPEAWKKCLKHGVPIKGEFGDLIINLFNNQIQIFNGWSITNEPVSDIINDSKIYKGYPFASLEHVLSYKNKLLRLKDIYHIKLIKKHLKNSKSKFGSDISEKNKAG